MIREACEMAVLGYSALLFGGIHNTWVVRDWRFRNFSGVQGHPRRPRTSAKRGGYKPSWLILCFETELGFNFAKPSPIVEASLQGYK